MESNFKVGDLVWARMKTYPPWPARVEESKDAQRKGQIYVYFFGSKPTYGYVPVSAVVDFDSTHKVTLTACKKPNFKVALQLAQEYKESMGKKQTGEIEAETGEDGTSAKPSENTDKDTSKDSVDSGEGSSKGASKRKASDIFEKGSKKPKSVVSSICDDSNGISSRIELLNRPAVLERPDSPTVDFASTSDLLESKEIVPSTLKFGFIGLGIIGQRLVKNLVQSGHHVNVWSRSPLKSNAIKEQVDGLAKGKLEVFIAPCEVMKHSDIVYSCSLDPQTAKNNVFGNCGIIQENNDTLDGKGYVEMTGIDSKTSKLISDEITRRGGRYLEAQLQGSRDEAEEGSMVILTAGDKSLFVDCQSCFKAMGKTSLFLGEVGLATKVYLILQLMKGIALVGLAEGLVLADRCGISAKDIMEIFNMTGLACPYLKNKADIIINKDFKKVEHSIQNMQKDIKLALGLSDEYMQPLMMASAANEVYKHSRKLGYDEHDCACIYMKARY